MEGRGKGEVEGDGLVIEMSGVRYKEVPAIYVTKFIDVIGNIYQFIV